MFTGRWVHKKAYAVKGNLTFNTATIIYDFVSFVVSEGLILKNVHYAKIRIFSAILP